MNFHVRIHCELRTSVLDAFSDNTIVDSGAGDCIVNIWYHESIFDFVEITGDITGAGSVVLGAITGAGKIMFLNKIVFVYYCETIPKSVMAVS